MAFRDYSTNPSDNTTLGDGTYIGPNMLRNKVRPAFQQIAADGKELTDEVDSLAAGLAADSVVNSPGFAAKLLSFDEDGAPIGLPFATPQAYAAAADGVTDDNTAFQALATEDQGHGVNLPADRYRLSAPQIYRGHVDIKGQGFGQNPGTVDGTSYAFPTFFNGSVLYTDAGVSGLEFQPFTSETNVTTVLANIAAHQTQQSAYGSRIEGLAIVSAGNGATYAAKRGLYSRTRIFAENVWAHGHGDEGFRIEASSDVADGHAYGNANLSNLTSCDATDNDGDGFYFGGRDMNGSVFVGLNAQGNGDWGFNDQGLLGNAYIGCHAAGNTTGSFRGDSAVAAHVYVGCYVETDSGKMTDLGPLAMVIGGTMAFDANHPADSPAFVLNAGQAIRKGISGLNNLTATSVTAGLGRDPTMTAGGKIAQWFGTFADPGGNSDEHRLKYEYEWTGIWAWNYRNAISYMEFPSAQATHYATLANPMAVGFPQGMVMGTAFSAPRLLPAAAAAPVAGTYRRGDVVYNNAPSASGFVGWVCVTAGTPGTWKTFGAISA
jgi:hypothetical protein